MPEGAFGMLKSDLKQNLVLLVFCFLLFEVLTGATLGFVVFGIVLTMAGIKTNKLVRNVLAIGVFASYWLTYGKIIDTEVGLNFLTSIIVLKILEKETTRDRYMIFFGMLLLISAGSLFEKTLTYVIFFGISFFILITDFYAFLGQRFRLKDLAIALLWVSPLTFLLFFFVPRLLNPIPFNQNTLTPGEIGYTADVNISEIDSLESNGAPVFQVSASRKLSMDELYWRGNTLSYTDGWNWKLMTQDRETPFPVFAVRNPDSQVAQKIRLFTTPEYFFALDYPGHLSFGDQIYLLNGKMKTFAQTRWDWVQRYEAWSDPKFVIEENEELRKYLQIPLPRKIREDIQRKFPGSTLDEVSNSVRSYFLKESFSYSLSPGKSRSYVQFMNKKAGFCSHFASATALILRVKGIPTRLVSGFMGGTYNEFGDFYLVSQNDAHVWVEALENGRWKRLDPTGWISPSRVSMGGEAFMSRRQSETGIAKYFSFLRTAKMWFQQWDFQFYQWLEQMDYHGQEAWLEKIHFKREWLYSFLPLMLVIFMLIYTVFLSTRKKGDSVSAYQELWSLFHQKMRKKGVELSSVSVSATQEILSKHQDENVKSVWNDLYDWSFSGKKVSVPELKKRIKKI